MVQQPRVPQGIAAVPVQPVLHPVGAQVQQRRPQPADRPVHPRLPMALDLPPARCPAIVDRWKSAAPPIQQGDLAEPTAEAQRPTHPDRPPGNPERRRRVAPRQPPRHLPPQGIGQGRGHPLVGIHEQNPAVIGGRMVQTPLFFAHRPTVPGIVEKRRPRVCRDLAGAVPAGAVHHGDRQAGPAQAVQAAGQGVGTVSGHHDHGARRVTVRTSVRVRMGMRCCLLLNRRPRHRISHRISHRPPQPPPSRSRMVSQGTVSQGTRPPGTLGPSTPDFAPLSASATGATGRPPPRPS